MITRPLVFYHASCNDGWCAAWLVKKVYVDAELVPAQYGGAEPYGYEGRDVFILDFCFPLATMERIANECRSLVVIDHHASAERLLKQSGFKLHFHWDAEVMMNPPIRNIYREGSELLFDMTKSGGRLTWEYLRRKGFASLIEPQSPLSGPEGDVPWLVNYTQDRDLWCHKLPFSKEVNAVIRSHPRTHEQWDILQQQEPLESAFVKQGAAILRNEQQMIDNAVYHAREITLAGHKVLAVNSTVLFSDIAGELAKGRAFGCAFFIRSDGQMQWSLRSTPEGEDVSKIAEQLGGGGHRGAAGFECSLDAGLAVLRPTLQETE